MRQYELICYCRVIALLIFGESGEKNLMFVRLCTGASRCPESDLHCLPFRTISSIFRFTDEKFRVYLKACGGIDGLVVVMILT